MNETQLEQEVHDWGNDLLRFCRITAGSKEGGDELYQDTMLVLLEKQKQLDPTQNIKSYAVSVSLKLWKNRSRKFLRRLQLVPLESLDSLSEQGILPYSMDSAPEDILLHRSQIMLVRQLVSQLPEKYRIPIQLYYSADLPIASIADILKLSENTVKSQLYRGKDIIRRKLEELDHERTAI